MTNVRGRGGRPRQAQGEGRTASLPPLRVTEAERARVREQAERAMLSVSEYCRRVILDHEVTPAASELDAAALSDLNRVGVNLNQIARHVHVHGRPPQDLAETLAEVRAAVEKLAGRMA